MGDTLDRADSVGGIELSRVCQILDGEVICGAEALDQVIESACGCDLMSDVLAFTRPGSILLTGLTNAQVVRTAEMLDLKAIVFVRSKRPDDATIELAKSVGMVLICSPYPLYESCGRLYMAGLCGCQEVETRLQPKVAEA
jgi:predicted transcriptional regulator